MCTSNKNTSFETAQLKMLWKLLEPSSNCSNHVVCLSSDMKESGRENSSNYVELQN